MRCAQIPSPICPRTASQPYPVAINSNSGCRARDVRHESLADLWAARGLSTFGCLLSTSNRHWWDKGTPALGRGFLERLLAEARHFEWKNVLGIGRRSRPNCGSATRYRLPGIHC